MSSKYELISRSFVVSKSGSVGAKVTGRITADHRFVVEARFPPNPTQFADPARHDVVGAYRVRDQDSDPNVGALVRSWFSLEGLQMGTLTAPDNSTSSVPLIWNDTESAWIAGDALTAPGEYHLDLAPGALVDSWGNDNGVALSITATR